MTELPEAFISRIKPLFKTEFESFIAALEMQVPISIRLNQGKPSAIHPTNPVMWATNAFYLSSRPSFTFDPLFHAGCYYVQEASSMFLEQIIKQYITEPVKCLDLCAAPGGKSTHLSAILPEGSLLVANEVIRSRSYILAENLIKWGDSSVIVTNNEPATIGKIQNYFDVIVADVPCSGEGMFRKDKNSITEWSVSNVYLCAERQKKIIEEIWPALTPGGLLIYSTCTFNTEENEKNIQWIKESFNAEPLTILTEKSWNICKEKIHDNPCYRFIPGITEGEGFFIAVLRKPFSEVTKKNRYKKNENKPITNNIKFPVTIKSWIQSPEDYYFEVENNIITAIPEIHKNNYKLLKNMLKVIHAGIAIGEMKGKDIIPSHTLAMSKHLRKESFPSVALDKDLSLSYLHKDTLQSLPPDTPKGHILMTFEGHPLGFAKNIGSRANNLYPQEWRIRKANPDSI